MEPLARAATAPDTALRVAYVGSLGYHGLLSVDPNDIPAQICSAAGGCQAGGAATSGAAAAAASQSHVPQGAQYIPVGTRPNPYLGAGFFWYTEGNSSYNALQTDVTHRLSSGLQFRANYTWSKNLDMNSGLTGAQAQNQSQMIMDRNDLRRDWGPSALDVASQASISARYELPFGRGKRWVTECRRCRRQADRRLAAQRDRDAAERLSLHAADRREPVGRRRHQESRPALFESGLHGTGRARAARPVVQSERLHSAGLRHLREFGEGRIHGARTGGSGLSLFKNTALTERVRLQFRAEFFNVLNHTNLGTPNATTFSGSAFNASAGLITTLATTPRQIQFGLKLIF